jgi:hypothetical protein
MLYHYVYSEHYANKGDNMATSNEYVAYYESQVGGQLRVFRGGLQSGAGLGDVLRGLLRFLMPVALRGISSFAGNMLAGTKAGLPLAMAARAAVGPAVSAVAGPAAARFVNSIVPGIVPTGIGSTSTTAATKDMSATADVPASVQKGSGVLFDGVDGVPATMKAAKEYKRRPHPIDASATFGITAAAAGGKRPVQRSKSTARGKTVHFNF